MTSWLSFANAPLQGEAAEQPRRLTFDEVKQHAHPAARQILEHLFPGGTVIAGEWTAPHRARGGPGDGLKFNLKTGQWGAFNGALNPSSGGDIISLWAAAKGMKPVDGLNDLAEWLGIDGGAYKPLPPVPAAPPPEPKPDGAWWADEKVRDRRLYVYKDRDGTPWIQVEEYRHKTAKDSKGKTLKHFGQWDLRANRWFRQKEGHPLPDVRPLYNLDLLAAADPSVPVVIVEGEKKADALVAAGILATSCIGGVRGVPYTDWSPLAGRRVVRWPDADTTRLPNGQLPAEVWAEALKAPLEKLGCAVHDVAIPLGRGDGWDAADATPEERVALVAAALGADPTVRPRPDPWALGDWRVDAAFDARPEPVHWLLRDTFALGEASLLAAIGGAGKGMTLLDLGLAVAAGPEPGTEWAGQQVLGREVDAHGAVVIIAAEDSKASVERRLHSLDADGRIRKRLGGRLMVVPLPNVGGAPALFSTVQGIHQPTAAWHALTGRLRAIKGLALVAFDPLAAFCSVPFDTEMNAASCVTSAMAQLAADTGAAVIVSHHMRKDGGGKGVRITSEEQARNAVVGSVGLVNGVRATYALYGVEDEQAREALAKKGRPAKLEVMTHDVVAGGIVKENNQASRRQHVFVRHEGTGRLEAVQLDSAPDSLQMQALVASVKRANELGTPFKANTGANGIGHGKIKPILPPVIVRGTVLKMVERAIGLGLLETKVKGGWITLPGEDLAEKLETLEAAGLAQENYRSLFGPDPDAWKRYAADPDDFRPDYPPSTATG